MPNDSCELAERIEPASLSGTDSSRSRLLQRYEAIARASCAMLSAARAGDWVEVARAQARCCALIAALKASVDTPLSPSEGVRRMQLLRRILSDDAQIRDHAEPWLEAVAPYVSTPRTGADNETGQTR